MVEAVELLRQAERVLRDDRQLQRPHRLVHDVVEPRGLEHEAPELVRVVAAVGDRVRAGDGQRRDDAGGVESFAVLQLREDVVGADDGVLQVGAALPLEAQRLVDVERDHLAARELHHEVADRRDGDRLRRPPHVVGA